MLRVLIRGDPNNNGLKPKGVESYTLVCISTSVRISESVRMVNHERGGPGNSTDIETPIVNVKGFYFYVTIALKNYLQMTLFGADRTCDRGSLKAKFYENNLLAII